MNERPKERVPFLEHFPEEGQPPHRVFMRTWPFRVGRSEEAEHTIHSRRVSSFHAEITKVGDGFVVRDLGSTNGTFVNGTRVEQHWLKEGDLLHIAHVELRFGLVEMTAVRRERTLTTRDDEQQRILRETNDLVRILDRGAVKAVFQPIVRLTDGARVAYETLGRGDLEGAEYRPGDLFRIAGERREAARLSGLMRQKALEAAVRIPEKPVAIFFNLHPTEMLDPATLDAALAGILAALGPEQSAVIEIHESAVTDLRAMAGLRARFHEVGIRLAYDDFGAGQSRLMELVEVPPDFLKLDMALVRDIDRNAKRQDLVGALISVLMAQGIEVLAEGIEREDEARVCARLGCQLGQGYFFGRPEAAP